MINNRSLNQLKTLLTTQGFVITESPFIATRSTGGSTYCVIEKVVHSTTNNEALSLEARQHDGSTVIGIIEKLTDKADIDAVTDFTSQFITKNRLNA